MSTDDFHQGTRDEEIPCAKLSWPEAGENDER